MDDRQFDNVVRSFARRRSRRTLVGGLLGGSVGLLAAHLRMPGAAARQGGSSQGQPCSVDGDCVVVDTLLVCAYNGYGSAGLACCAPSGGSCGGSDADCCGPSTCYLGTCADLSAPSVGDACWQLSGDPDPCGNDAVCTHDSQSGSAWGTCQSLSGGGVDSGYACPDDCSPNSDCAGCSTGYCLYDGTCAFLAQ